MESSIILVVELIGIVAFAVSGAVVAIDKGLDVFGVAFIGEITALGGGVIRDAVLGIFPPIRYIPSLQLYLPSLFSSLPTGTNIFFMIMLKELTA